MAVRPKKKASLGGGLGRVAQAVEQQGSGDREWISIEDGGSVVVRVLDVGDQFKDAYVHSGVEFVKNEGKKDESKTWLDVPCLDQKEEGIPCPGCKDDVYRKYKFVVNVIERDSDGDEAQDKLKLWSGGITIAKSLDKKNSRVSIAERDLEIFREGVKKKTRYEVEWAEDESTELTKHDKVLAKNKHDVTYYLTPPSFDEFYVHPSERTRDDNDDDDEDDADDRASRRQSAFAGKKKSASKSRSREEDDEDDDDDDEEETPRRSKSKIKNKTSTTIKRRRR